MILVFDALYRQLRTSYFVELFAYLHLSNYFYDRFTASH